MGVCFEVLKAQTSPLSRLSLFHACGSDVNSQLLIHLQACLLAARLPHPHGLTL